MRASKKTRYLRQRTRIDAGRKNMDISIILSTYNRGELLRNALEHLRRQQTDGIEYEIIVVNNNSTDGTKEIVESFIAQDPHFRYIFEERQGLSYARNTGIAAARADLLVFCDDDVETSPTWIQKNYEAFARFPEADYIGGKVLPIWMAPVPNWVRKGMGPFALSDLGDTPVVVSPDNQHCIVGASLGIRRSAFNKAGLFSIKTQRVKNTIGSTEDFDWQMKIWSHGGHGVYVPDIECATEVPPDRLSKSYHRRWHLGHGKFNAIGDRPRWRASRTFLNVPLFVYRQTAEAALRVIAALLRGVPAETFKEQEELLFYVGFIQQRWKMRGSSYSSSVVLEKAS